MPARAVVEAGPTRAHREAREEFTTGDLLCFRGRSLPSIVIRRLTASVYSHVGLVYRFEGRVYCLEAVASGVRLLIMSDLARRYSGRIDYDVIPEATQEQRQGAIYEPELHFAEDVLVPDQAGWRQERMPLVPNVAACEQPPDWVCEIISPSTGYLDRTRKLPIYARERVAYVWLIDPGTRTLEVLRLDGGRWVVAATHGGSTVMRAEPFETVEVDLPRLWGEA